MWKKVQTMWEEYRDTVRVCRDVRTKAKAHLELNLARDVNDDKKGFFKYNSRKRKTGENFGLLLNRTCALVTKDMEKTELIQSLLLRSALKKLRPWRQERKSGKRRAFP